MERLRLFIVDELREIGLDGVVQRHKLKVSRHGSYPELLLLKYDQKKTDFSKPAARECRGIVLKEGSWDVVAMPYTKFFNLGEEGCVFFSLDVPIRCYEKLDGSMCMLYHYDDKWHVASSGTPDGAGRLPCNLLFHELFWDVFFNHEHYILPDANENDNLSSSQLLADRTDARHFCFFFELVSQRNVVLVPLKGEELFLHGARDMRTLQEHDPEDVAKRFAFKCVPRLARITTLRQAREEAKKLSASSSEGFVCVDEHFARCKVKCPQYVALAHMSQKNQKGLNETFMLQVLCSHEHSEVLTYFPQWEKLYKTTKLKFDSLMRVLLQASAAGEEGKKNARPEVRDFLKRFPPGEKLTEERLRDELEETNPDLLQALVNVTSKARQKVKQRRQNMDDDNNDDDDDDNDDVPIGMVTKKKGGKKGKKKN